MSEAFKVGDIVRLKSGGPRMTVEHVGAGDGPLGGGPYVACTWFDDANKPQSRRFKPDALEVSDAGPTIA